MCALFFQLDQAFTICIADDGSDHVTLQVVHKWLEKFTSHRLRHIWHPDNGFQKNKILNKAIESSSADYLIFLDGDCLTFRNFISAHKASAKINRFCTGGVIRLNDFDSRNISSFEIESNFIFSKTWLTERGYLYNLSNKLKAGFYPLFIGEILNRISPVKRTWNGGNSSTWRSVLLAVNGFDESLRYGAEDIELGFRLNNFGIKGHHIRYTSLVLHLEHTRGYADPTLIKYNKDYAKKIKLTKVKRTHFGIHQE